MDHPLQLVRVLSAQISTVVSDSRRAVTSGQLARLHGMLVARDRRDQRLRKHRHIPDRRGGAGGIPFAGAGDHPVAPLLPPTVAPPPPTPQLLPMPTLPRTLTHGGVLIGVAVSHSGRVRDLTLLDALGWAPGDRTTTDIQDGAILLQRHPTGPHRINNRREAFLPAGARALLGIAANTRVLLAADPTRDILAIYPDTLVAAILTDHQNTHRTRSQGHEPTAHRPDHPAFRPDTQPMQTDATEPARTLVGRLPVVSIRGDTP